MVLLAKRQWFYAMLALVGSVLLLASAQSGPATRAQVDKQNGISYAAWNLGDYSHPDSDLSLSNLAATGANWTSIIALGYQETITSAVINYISTPGPDDSDLIHVIDQAHRMGLKVMLKPHLLIQDEASWSGLIGQGFTEADWNAWFASYQDFIRHYALLAQSSGVEQFSVGAELTAAEHRTEDWRALIAEVRKHFTGPITYAANWGTETEISWWDAVDYIGVDPYYPLASDNQPTLVELRSAWGYYSTEYGELSSRWNKPILFTELGYRSLDGAVLEPSNWQVEGTPDLQEQADAYEAVFETVYDQPWFAGMFWWTWTADPLEGSLCDTSYTPHSKPAENILRKWFGASPLPDPGPLPLPVESQVLEVYTDQLSEGWEDWSWDTSALNFADTGQVYHGAHSVAVDLQPGGALSLHHETLHLDPYFWLEFYILESAPDQQFVVYLNDENDSPLRIRSLNDCRYRENMESSLSLWRRIRIPLSDLGAVGQGIVRVSIQNWNPKPSALRIDEMRFVGASPLRLFLPTIPVLTPNGS